MPWLLLPRSWGHTSFPISGGIGAGCTHPGGTRRLHPPTWEGLVETGQRRQLGSHQDCHHGNFRDRGHLRLVVNPDSDSKGFLRLFLWAWPWLSQRKQARLLPPAGSAHTSPGTERWPAAWELLAPREAPWLSLQEKVEQTPEVAEHHRSDGSADTCRRRGREMVGSLFFRRAVAPWRSSQINLQG